MGYSIRIKSSATRELARIPKQIRLRIVHAIDNLGDHPLSGRPLKGEFRGLRRVRVGDYRIMHEVHVDALVVLVVRVAHRREVYRRR